MLKESFSAKVKSICLFLMTALFIAMTMAGSVHAADASNQKVVKVGYVNVKGYEEGGKGEYKTGFGYEYFQKISYYTGWKYEYVYGSFSELFKLLSEGEIDIMGNITATEARAKLMNFSAYPEGSESFYVYIKNNDDELLDSKPQALAGKRIGVSKGSFQAQLMKEYFAKQGIAINQVELNGTNGVKNALNKGEIDAAVFTDAADLGFVPLHHIGFHDYHFAVNKNRPDLLEELNNALYQIQSADPNYNITVAKKYSFGTVGVHYLSKKEKAWLEQHKNNIRLGYLNDNMPFSNRSGEGELEGVMGVVIQQLQDRFKINAVPKGYASVSELREALKSGEIDCIGPLYGDYYVTEQYDLIQSEALISTTPVILYKNKLKTDTIAVSDKSIFSSSVVNVLYPKAGLVKYNTTEDCMKAVAKGEVDSTIITSAMVNVLRKYDSMSELSYTELLRNADLCLFLKKGDGELLKILNKAIFHSQTRVKGVAFVHASSSDMHVTWEQFIKLHMKSILIIAAVVILSLIALLYKVIVAQKNAAMAKASALESENKARESRMRLQAVSLEKDQLEKQAETNPVTQLANSVALLHDVQKYELEQLAIYSIDVNGLKEVNDRCSHDVGNELLQAAASVIKTVFKDCGKCYHIHGDEFIVLLHSDLERAPMLIKELKEACAAFEHKDFAVSLSVGYVLGADYPEESLEGLYHLADQEMYKDKVDHYRNKVFDRRNSKADSSISRIATNLSEYVPGGYFVYEASAQEELLYVNTELLNIYECSTKEQFTQFVGGSFKGMVHPEDLDRISEEIKRQIYNHMDLDYTEYRIITAKGNVKKVRDYGRYVSRLDGSGIFYVMISEIG